MKLKIALLGMIFFMSTAAGQALSQGTPQLPATRLQTRFSGLSSPVFLTHAGDGSKRLFIVERAGVIRVVQAGSSVPSVFLNITALTTTDLERGLLGLAFHPEYKTNRRFFVYFTRTDGDLQISEFEASPTNPNVALTVEKPILRIEHSQDANHNGGTIAFGADGYLYAAPGDGGNSNDPSNNAQNIDSLLGKVLRIDINVPAGQTEPYLIPPTNPFAGATPGRDEIYAVGFRNPFRWSFDRGGTNQLWLADVGQDSWEEVNIIVSGGNYGWRVFEGNSCTGLGPEPCNAANYVPPVFVYSSQNTSSRCSITGGYVYRGRLGTLPNGAYVYGDYCTGEILLWHNGQQIPIHESFNVVSFGEDEDGELYVVHSPAGKIQKLITPRVNADLNGDLRTDLTVYRPSDFWWYTLNPVTGVVGRLSHGDPNTTPVPEDYDGDRRMDLAFFRPADGAWVFVRSSDQMEDTVVGWGVPGDIPLPGDYDGDAKADFMLYRPSNGVWYLRSSNGVFSSFQWGEADDIPIVGDFDGDSRTDLTVWRSSNGNWYTIFSSNNAIKINQYGVPGDIPATGDFDGDGRNDLAVFRPSTGQWFHRLSASTKFVRTSWGVEGDIPVVGDYDGDGRDDIAVWRPSSGTWFIIKSTGGILQVPGWGVAGDIPIPNLDTP